MARTATVNLTCKFEDNKTRKISLGPIDPSALVNVKSRIITYNNAATREQDFPGFDEGFVSDGGAKFVNFSAANIVVTEETVIFQ